MNETPYSPPEWLTREVSLIGEQAVEILAHTSVLLFGAGGVGGFAAEGLIRAGIGRLVVVDHDIIAESNLNRQIIADVKNIGLLKADELCRRAESINPAITALPMCIFADDGNISEIIEIKIVKYRGILSNL